MFPGPHERRVSHRTSLQRQSRSPACLPGKDSSLRLCRSLVRETGPASAQGGTAKPERREQRFSPASRQPLRWAVPAVRPGPAGSPPAHRKPSRGAGILLCRVEHRAGLHPASTLTTSEFRRVEFYPTPSARHDVYQPVRTARVSSYFCHRCVTEQAEPRGLTL